MSIKQSKYGSPARAAATTHEPAARPLSFATVVLAIAGILNIIEAAAAFGGDGRFDENRIFLDSLTGWGVAVLIIGLLQLYAAREIHLRKPAGLLWGIGLASISGISHFMMIGAYPLWAITVMVVNFGVIFALTTNDDAF